MLQFKSLVTNKTGIEPDQQRLIYAGKQFEDEKHLSDYGLQEKHTVYLVSRLPGGSHDSELRPFPAGVACYNENCSICYNSPSLKMPCGHFSCPTCVVEYSWNEANTGTKTEIKCSEDETEWKLSIIQQYGCVSDNEMDALRNKLSENFIKRNPDIRECPGCGCYCEQMDKTKGRVYCQQCAKENKTATYCFYCSKPWNNPSSAIKCGNSNCDTGVTLNIVRTAPRKKIIGVSCPSIRLCPKCGSKIEHKEFCKHMTCKSCGTEFCFICLRTKQCGMWQCGGYNTKCTAAPIQTSIPKLSI